MHVFTAEESSTPAKQTSVYVTPCKQVSCCEPELWVLAPVTHDPVCAAGSEVEVDMKNDVLTDLSSGRKFSLKPLGEVRSGAVWSSAANVHNQRDMLHRRRQWWMQGGSSSMPGRRA